MSTSTKVKVKIASAGESTLAAHQYNAQRDGHSMYSAAVAYVLRDRHFDPLGYDQCNLAICLTTFLIYLYSRSCYVALASFALWFVFESVVYSALLPLCSPAIRQHVVAVEARDYEPIIDWLLFALALALAVYALSSHTLLALTVPATFPSATEDWVALVVVPLVSTLAVFPDIFFLSGALLLAAIWLVYAFSSPLLGALHLGLAIRASIATVYFYAWFRSPIAYSFVYNAFMSLFAAAFLLSLVSGLSV